MSEAASALVENFFRHESGRLVSVLTRIFGWSNLDLVEEMVQATLVDALEAWRHKGIPDNPAGWIHRVARNKIIDSLRRDKIGARVLAQWSAPDTLDQQFIDSAIEDSQLRMIFACCHPRLTRENQLAFTLKTLCGFGVAEIARALLLNEETVKKRLQRARQEIVRNQISLETPADPDLDQRLDAVHQTLYLLFNQGYTAIEPDVCEDAAWLCHLLCSNDRFRTPATLALMALMLFHSSRLEGRLDSDGGMLLMEEQDRSRWDQRLIAKAEEYLLGSATGQNVTTYHLEAAIAAHHCRASSYAETDWKAILRLYDALLTLHRSPVYLLNRAIALAEVQGPEVALQELRDANLGRYYLYEATMGELHRRVANFTEARRHLEVALEQASPQDRAVIERRLASCQNVDQGGHERSAES